MMECTELHDGGWLHYEPAFLPTAEADALFQHLVEAVPWRQEVGRLGPFPRLTAWYADDGKTYSYSGVTHVGLIWSSELILLKQQLSHYAEFNSALLNRYRHGQDSMGWHADDEKELGVNPVIASISLGAVRRFRLKHLATRESLAFDLSHGSLLVMGGTTQHHYQHAVMKTTQSVNERINLTFRRIL